MKKFEKRLKEVLIKESMGDDIGDILEFVNYNIIDRVKYKGLELIACDTMGDVPTILDGKLMAKSAKEITKKYPGDLDDYDNDEVTNAIMDEINTNTIMTIGDF